MPARPGIASPCASSQAKSASPIRPSRAAAVYLNIQQLIPEDRTAQAPSNLFGAPLICPASIVAWVGKKAQELRQVYQFIGERVAEAKVRHLDETGFRIAGKLQWLHTTSSLAFTFYRADEKRGAIPEDLQGGVVVHDHFLPYRRLDAVDHAFCNAHILRELKSLIEFDHEPWAELMRDLLLAANLAVDKAREAGARALAPDQLEAFVERYWAAVRLGLAFHRDLPKLAAKANPRGRVKHRPGHNLLQRLKTFQTETLRFLTDFDVPFTNNLAEQDLRMMKVKMKISGSFRTLAGAQIFARLRSVVSTAKHRYNILQILTASPAQTYEPEVAVEVREWIAPALASPDFVLGAQPPAQPHGCVSVERPIRLVDGSYSEVVRPSAQHPVHFAHQRCGLLPCSRSVGQRMDFLDHCSANGR